MSNFGFPEFRYEKRVDWSRFEEYFWASGRVTAGYMPMPFYDLGGIEKNERDISQCYARQSDHNLSY